MAYLTNQQGPLGPFYDGTMPVDGYAGLPGEAMTKGAGFTGTGSVYLASVQQDGPFVKTTIFIDLTGLNSSAAADIIGGQGAANSHIGRVTTAVNGLIFRGQVSCAETPLTGEPDIDLYSADEATGTEDAAIGGLVETAILDAAADWTKGVTKAFTGNVVADQYLYLVGSGGGTDATYTAGQLVIEMWGVKV